MIPIASLQNIHAGRPAAVLGGGPSLPADLPRVPPGAVLISVNHHALRYIHADYTVFLDDLARMPMPGDEIRSKGGLFVTRQPEMDIDLGGSTWWQGRFSSHLACWFACWLGCSPVLLCGMDLYRNPIPPGDDPRNQAYQTPLAEHLAGWREAFQRCPHPERIRAMSGPLVAIFGKWQASPLLQS
ncbi:MAG: hypothetical protein A2010_08475 [Nitrospirae bacterium GWD2_57_9]|nr:MAG: hypothetical protein A2010_08475 [Nitrospirae bacterium GWD2_57_9]